jgi:tetratricopeptide (TPR) repeat protein
VGKSQQDFFDLQRIFKRLKGALRGDRPMRKVVLILFVFTLSASITSHVFQQKWQNYRKAESCFLKEHYEEALFSYLQALRWGLEEETISSHFVFALSKIGGGFEKINPFIQRIEKEGQKAHLLTKVALIFLHQSQPNEAENALQTITQKNSSTHQLLARSLYLQGKKKESIVEYKKALEKNPLDDALRHEFAEVLVIERQYKEAQFHYQKLLQKKKNPSLVIEVAHLLFQQQENFAALEILEDLGEKQIDEKTQLLLARLYAKENRFDRSENSYLLYLEKKPSDLTARQELAGLYHQNKKYASATQEWKKILEKDPDDCYARRALSFSLLGEYRSEVAKKELACCFHEKTKNSLIPPKKRINDFQARLVFARLLHLQEGNLEKASEQYKILIKEKPNDAKLHIELGEIWQKLGEEAKALDEFLAALSIDPNNIRAQLNESKSYLRVGAYEKALVLLKKIPSSSSAQKLLLEVAHFLKGEKKLMEAISIYKDLIEKREDKQLLEEIADLFYENHQMKDSLFYYQKALKMDPGSKILKKKIRQVIVKSEETSLATKKLHFNP